VVRFLSKYFLFSFFFFLIFALFFVLFCFFFFWRGQLGSPVQGVNSGVFMSYPECMMASQEFISPLPRRMKAPQEALCPLPGRIKAPRRLSVHYLGAWSHRRRLFISYFGSRRHCRRLFAHYLGVWKHRRRLLVLSDVSLSLFFFFFFAFIIFFGRNVACIVIPYSLLPAKLSINRAQEAFFDAILCRFQCRCSVVIACIFFD
jgi:hypothetical protein